MGIIAVMSKSNKTPSKIRAAREKKVLLGLAGGLTIGAGALLGGRQEMPPPNDIPLENITTDTGLTPVQSAPSQSFRARITEMDRTRHILETERVAVLPEPSPVGLLVDSDSENFCNFRLECRKEGNDIKIYAIPQIESGRDKEYTYQLNQGDLFAALCKDASPKEVNALLEQYRTMYRYDESSPTASVSGPQKTSGLHEQKTILPEPAQDNHDAAVAVATIPEDGKIVMQIDIGAVNSSNHQWLKSLSETPAGIAQALSAELNKPGSFANFMREAVLDPETGDVDYHGYQTMLRAHALAQKDRAEFAQAVQNNDTAKASLILTRMSAEIPIGVDDFQTLARFVQTNISDEVSASDIVNAFDTLKSYRVEQKALTDVLTKVKENRITYEEIPEIFLNSDGLYERKHNPKSNVPASSVDGIIAKVAQLSPEAYKTIRHSKLYVLEVLAETAATTSKGYSDFIRAAEAREKSEAVEIPQHTMHVMQQNLRQFMGTNGQSGWIDSTDREHNVPSIIHQILMLDSLRNVQSMAHSAKRECPVTKLLTIRNGRVYLTSEVDTSYLDDANDILGSVNKIMRAMHRRQPLLGRAYDEQGQPRTGRERYAEYTAREQSGTVDQATLGAPDHILGTLDQMRPPEAEIGQLLAGTPPEKAKVQFSEARDNGGVKYHTIETTPHHHVAAMTDSERSSGQSR